MTTAGCPLRGRSRSRRPRWPQLVGRQPPRLASQKKCRRKGPLQKLSPRRQNQAKEPRERPHLSRTPGPERQNDSGPQNRGSSNWKGTGGDGKLLETSPAPATRGERNTL
ncbi:uncharacterized protein LOC141889377 isoform X3 [Acropora palmata]|uniref:uncharacterized protein LOC141889377 isoform X3 n=1 Tax=Acropora palmata TaxID=6131 RepID=UPI003DA19FE9